MGASPASRSVGVTLALATAIALALVACGTIGDPGDDAGKGPCGFDRQVWLRVQDGGSQQAQMSRNKLADTLADCADAEGISREDVRRLLGAPDGGSARSDGSYTYDIGNYDGIGIDSYFLDVEFVRGRVSSISIDQS